MNFDTRYPIQNATSNTIKISPIVQSNNLRYLYVKHGNLNEITTEHNDINIILISETNYGMRNIDILQHIRDKKSLDTSIQVDLTPCGLDYHGENSEFIFTLHDKDGIQITNNEYEVPYNFNFV